MSVVIPAVIPHSLEEIFATAKSVKSFCREIQIDVLDGMFVSEVSWPYGVGALKGEPIDVRMLSEMFDIEFDLMVIDPETEFPRYLLARPKRVIAHVGSMPRSEALARMAHEAGARFGLAASNDVPLEFFLEELEHADYAQCMGISPVGVQGAPFDERTIERIRAVRTAFPDIEVAVDGSVNKDTVPRLREAGVTRFVSGSAILGAPDPKNAYDELVSLSSSPHS